MPRGLGDLDVRFFGYVQGRESATVTTGELVQALGITPERERKLLSRLAGRGLITRVRRGLYLIPSRLPSGGKWSPGEAKALTALMSDRGARYQICGPNAFSRYGWDDQVPNRVFAYNNRISGERQIGSTSLILIKVADNRLGDTDIAATPNGIDLIYSSRVRSLLDAVYDWSRFNTLPRAYDWIRQELRRDPKTAAALTEATLRYGNQGTIRRIGKLLETEGTSPSLVRKLERSLGPTTSLIGWNPAGPKRGKIDRRWGLVLNAA